MFDLANTFFLRSGRARKIVTIDHKRGPRTVLVSGAFGSAVCFLPAFCPIVVDDVEVLFVNVEVEVSCLAALSSVLTATLSCHITVILFHVFARLLASLFVTMRKAA